MTDAGEFKNPLDKYEPEADTAEAGDAADAKAKERQRKSDMVDEWGDESFPASDPPGHY